MRYRKLKDLCRESETKGESKGDMFIIVCGVSSMAVDSFGK